MIHDDPYTMELCLCGDDGMVEGEHLETHARLRRLGGHEPYTGGPYQCTGHAHLAGEHIRCTSTFHALPPAPLAATVGFTNQVFGAPLNGWQTITAGGSL